MSFALFLTACGGNPSAEPTGASLEGQQNERKEEEVPIPPPPTEIHGKMARLLPRQARLNDTLSYCGWDAEGAVAYSAKEVGEDGVKKAPMPCVKARFSSTGYELVGVPGEKGDDKMMAQTYPQVCDIYIIETPAADAAAAVLKKIVDQLTRQQFEKKDALRITLNKDGTGPLIDQYLRVDSSGDNDIARVAYTQVVGTRVIYALESEVRKPVVGPGGEKIKLPTTTQLGSRVGAQVIFLVNDNMTR